VAAVDGPVILLNISESRSDAIVLWPWRIPTVVPLQGATPQLIAEIATKIHNEKDDSTFEELLRDIWTLIVQPVVRVLLGECPKGSRIWWCPTGPASLLPLHAAGESSQTMPNLYISSYTPTLSALIRARRNASAKSKSSRLLVVGQSNAPGQASLPSVAEEINLISSIEPNLTILDGFNATSESVLEAMESHSRIHLSCHGHINHLQPFLSQFSLHDGSLTVSDIVKRNLPDAELAFLSACHSAAGNRSTPDEVLHLAASLQFAGFRSVVGTMWEMVDHDGPDIAEAFYASLLGLGVERAPSSAHALHRATAKLRRRGVTALRWACFVHFGC
jgi:CHAT domain-containing protein